MSVENRPNLHAVGLLTDILKAIDARRRGKAGEVPWPQIMPLVAEDTGNFIELVNAILDHQFNTPAHEVISPLFHAVTDVWLDAHFERRMNSIVAPVTQAWTNYKLEKIIVNPGDIGVDDAHFTLIVSAERRKR